MGNVHSDGAPAQASTSSNPHHMIPGFAAAAAASGQDAAAAGCPVAKGPNSPLTALMGGKGNGAPGACPVVHAGSDAGAKARKERAVANQEKVYNVYSQEIDPTNMMPAANQNPSPGQQAPLSTQRVQSTIPKGGADSTWLYPSPQMFWNSLVRKGKAEGVHETDVDMVVAIHNEMNERTWRQLLSWEDRHKSEHLDGEPALRRFMGNPWKLSPKAQLKSYAGYGFPFDRHDWFVDRGGKQVHYIIDYYFNPNGKALPDDASKSPPFDASANYTRQIYVDVRPAVEDVTSALDRLVAFPQRAWYAFQRPSFVAEGLNPKDAPKDAESKEMAKHTSAAAAAPSTPVSPVSSVSADGVDWDSVDSKCGKLLESLKQSKSDEDRRSASLALNYCMGRILCPSEATNFMKVLEGNNTAGKAGEAGGDEEAAFEAMAGCVRGKVAARPRSMAQAATPAAIAQAQQAKLQ